jgi:hypothetical protein
VLDIVAPDTVDAANSEDAATCDWDDSGHGHRNHGIHRRGSRGFEASMMPPLNFDPMLLTERARIKYCRVCGTPVAYVIPADDNRERAVCPSCETVHYENPLNVVGTVPVWGAGLVVQARDRTRRGL